MEVEKAALAIISEDAQLAMVVAAGDARLVTEQAD